MMEIDARGLSCPEPVVMTRAALKDDVTEALVRVDNPCSAENVTRYAQYAGYRVEREESGDETRLLLRK